MGVTLSATIGPLVALVSAAICGYARCGEFVIVIVGTRELVGLLRRYIPQRHCRIYIPRWWYRYWWPWGEELPSRGAPRYGCSWRNRSLSW